MQKFLKNINNYENQKKPFSLGVYKVDFKRLEENIMKIRRHAENISGKKIQYLLPVKGGGYGCGMKEVSLFVQNKKLCEYLGVAHLQEAFELRSWGVTLPILVLGQTSSHEKFLNFIAEENIEIALSDEKFLERIEEHFLSLSSSSSFLGKKHPMKTSIHLKIDLGMGRCGVLEADAMKLFQKILLSPAVELKGVMMHFPVSDSEKMQDKDFTQLQIQKFLKISQKMKSLLGEKSGAVLFHCANSGATLEHQKSVEYFDMIRPGIASYGYPEEGKTQKILGLRPIVEVYSEGTLIKKYPDNFSIGYGRTYYTGKNSKNSQVSESVGIIPVGYADGLGRSLSNKYSIFSESGEEFPCVGRISMDQSAYLFPEKYSPSLMEKNKYFILGAFRNASELAKLQNTISYEVLIHFGNSERLKKIWVY